MRRTPLAGIMHGVEAAEKRESARRKESSVTSEEEKNKALARRLLEAFVNRELDTIEELLAPTFTDRSLLPGQGSSREEYKQSVTEFHAALSFADVTFEWSEGNLLEWILPSFEREVRMRERVEQELRVARSIQQASLPKEVPTLENWQITPYYQPAREVGGDFYDLFELEDGRVTVVMGDAAGKGIPAALVVSATSSVLRAVAQALGSSSPSEVLAQVNETLFARIPPNMFVTCFYAILDPKNGSMNYANAGHDLPYLWHGGDCEELRARGMPLGLMAGMSYEQKKIELDAGEGVLFYSDGLVEAHDA